MSLVESFQELVDPPNAHIEMAGQESRRGPGLDLAAVELLIDQAYQRGHADGWHERDEEATREWPAMRRSVVQRAAAFTADYLRLLEREVDGNEDALELGRASIRETLAELREAFGLSDAVLEDAFSGAGVFPRVARPGVGWGPEGPRV